MNNEIFRKINGTREHYVKQCIPGLVRCTQYVSLIGEANRSKGLEAKKETMEPGWWEGRLLQKVVGEAVEQSGRGDTGQKGREAGK